MPIIKGYSRRSFSKNVATEIRSGRPRKQAVAIAYSVGRRAARRAGKHPAWLFRRKRK